MEEWRVLVSSPSDARPSRWTLSEAIETVNQALIAAGRDRRLRLVEWPKDTMPGAHSQSAQRMIEEQLGFDNCDVVVGFFWKTVGTAVSGAVSGSASEILQAFEGWKVRGTPRILTYFNRDSIAVPQSSQEASALTALLEFKEDLRRREILTEDHVGDRELLTKVTRHLLKLAFESQQAEQTYLRSSFGLIVQADIAALRSEGRAEFIGDIRLSFDTTVQHSEIQQDVDVELTLSTNVVQSNLAFPPRLSIFRGARYIASIEGRVIALGNATNRVRFESVATQIDRETTIVISNVRSEAAQNMIASVFIPVPIVGSLTVRQGVHEVTSDKPFVVGHVRRGVLFSVRAGGRYPGDFLSSAQYGPESPRFVWHHSLYFEEVFPGVFKTGDQESRGNDLPGRAVSKTGTRLFVQFLNLPTKARLYVSSQERPISENPQTVFIADVDPSGTGGNRIYQTRAEQSDVPRYIEVKTDQPRVCWEWIDPLEEATPRRVTFSLVVTSDEIVEDRPMLMAIGMLAPFYTTRFLSDLRVPNFLPTNAPLNLVLSAAAAQTID